MTYKLSFQLPHKSIKKFSPVELPNFCLITGKNGSGKTHLLEAIRNGALSNSLPNASKSEIVLFDSNSIIPKDTGNYSPANTKSQESGFYQGIAQKRPAFLGKIQGFLRSFGLDPSRISDIETASKLLDENTFKTIFPDQTISKERYDQFKNNILLELKQLAPPASQRGETPDKLRRLSQIDPVILLTGSELQIFNHTEMIKSDVEVFQQAFGEMFTNYRGQMIINLAKQLEDSQGPHLDDQQFTKKFGPKPWDFVNSILELSNLDFRINHPNLDDPYGSFEPRLTKVSTNVEMKFADLSSGERVLMSFAVCLYNSSENRNNTAFPKLLLLDEIDAPLHPDMVEFILRTIRTVLVEKHKISVIFTTHSPTTVALFDEDSIFEMNAQGPALEKISKDRALSILTAGVPTVSISYNQRNQIFVESETDAVVLSHLYQIFKSSLTSARSVEFIKSGRKNASKVEENGGCARVKSVVKDLRGAGVNTVFGLIDWDKKNKREDGIFVLCEGTRYSIENLILDPVITISALAKEYIQFSRDRNLLEEGETFVGLIQWDQDRWQKAVDCLMHLLNLHDDQKAEVDYRNGMRLQFARSYLEMRGHDLSHLICDKFPPLKNKQQQAKLESYLAQNVVPEIKDLIPHEIITLFEELTAQEPH